MFGYVTANIRELNAKQRARYNSIYCGICRQIRCRSGQLSRLGLSYDMAFLAMLLMSLYEPEETEGSRACVLHPVRPKPWVDSKYIQYAADMNVALAYYNARDDWQDDQKLSARMMEQVFGRNFDAIAARFPRQCQAILECIAELSRLEAENCGNPDLVAGCFGRLMGELLVYEEDLWAPILRKMGMALGRFIYLGDAAKDFRRDVRKKKYNPFIAMGGKEDWKQWNEYLVLAMGACTEEFEKLPLVQDKAILDNILYSGVWVNFSRKTKEDGQ